MKKFAAFTLAALLMLACVPAFAFTGFVSDPGMPEITYVDDPVFSVSVRRVENEPIVTEDEWGDEVYEWTYMDDDAPIAAGDTVTLSCEIQVPAELPYGAELLEEIETLFVFIKYNDIELVMAYGCDTNYDCDYEHGYCFPLPGYGNAEVVGHTLEVHPHLGGNIRVIVRGVASDSNLHVTTVNTIGQYRVPCHFSCGKLEKTDNTYFVHYKDTFMVQDRGMKFIAEGEHIADYYVYFNNHDYHRVLDASGSYKYVEVVDGQETDNVITASSDAVKYEALELAYSTYMSFFGFVADNNADCLTDGVFLYGSEPVRFNTDKTFGSSSEDPDPTEPEPTEPVVDPTDPAPTEPVNPNPPATGAVSMLVLGVAAIVSGAGVALLKKKED